MSQLTTQLILGAGLIFAATAVQTIGIAFAMMARPRLVRHFKRATLLNMIVLICLLTLWLLSWQMAGVWIWALSLLWIDAFQDLEHAIYFSLAAYTTLGFGDVLPPLDWRVLGSVAGANGMLAFGLGTAALVAMVQGIQSDMSGDRQH
ncbi:MAG: ion channel [Pseudomonadota bacterium]